MVDLENSFTKCITIAILESSMLSCCTDLIAGEAGVNVTDFDRVLIVDPQARADAPAANGGNFGGLAHNNPFFDDVNPCGQVQNT